jgi:hypothetical protein
MFGSSSASVVRCPTPLPAYWVVAVAGLPVAKAQAQAAREAKDNGAAPHILAQVKADLGRTQRRPAGRSAALQDREPRASPRCSPRRSPATRMRRSARPCGAPHQGCDGSCGGLVATQLTCRAAFRGSILQRIIRHREHPASSCTAGFTFVDLRNPQAIQPNAATANALLLFVR